MIKKIKDRNDLLHILSKDFSCGYFLDCEKNLYFKFENKIKQIDFNVDKYIYVLGEKIKIIENYILKNGEIYRIYNSERIEKMNFGEGWINICANDSLFLGIKNDGMIYCFNSGKPILFDKRSCWNDLQSTGSFSNIYFFATRKNFIYCYDFLKKKFKRLSKLGKWNKIVTNFGYDAKFCGIRENNLYLGDYFAVYKSKGNGFTNITSLKYCCLSIKDKKLYCILSSGLVFCIENKKRWSKIYKNGICEDENGDKFYFESSIFDSVFLFVSSYCHNKIFLIN